MPSEIHVHLLPDHVETDRLRGGTAVIVDVLRASTTILTALNNGAAAILPCLSVDEANAHRDQNPAVLLGGERGGVRIDGFDLSNSPTDYDREVVGGRTIAFTTTNGTRALLRSTTADRIFIGSFVNAGRLAEALLNSAPPLHIVCAGTDGEVTGEDVLFAGCLTDLILNQASRASDILLSDTAAITLGAWRYESARQSLLSALQVTRGGRNLLALKFGDDLELAADVDSQPVLAAFDADSCQIRLMD